MMHHIPVTAPTLTNVIFLEQVFFSVTNGVAMDRRVSDREAVDILVGIATSPENRFLQITVADVITFMRNQNIQLRP